MKGMLWFLLASLATLVLAIAAFVLAYNGKDGWGWFLFSSMLCAVYPETNKEKPAEPDKQKI